MQYYYTDEIKQEKPGKTPPGKNFFTIVLIALLITLVGDILGGLLSVGLSYVISDGGWRFITDNYLPFLGSFIMILLYMAKFDPDLYRTCLSSSKGGLKRNNIKWLILGLLIGAGLNGFCALIAYFHGDLKFSFGSFDPIYLIAAFILTAIQSSAEELIMRGYVFQAVNRRHGLLMGIVCNSVFFALLHGANPGIGILPIIDLVLWGVLTTLAVYHLGGLWMVCMAHTAWNFTQNFLLGLPNSGLVSERALLHLDASSGSIFYDAAFGIEGGITAIIEMIILSVLLIISIRKTKNI